MTFSVPTKYKWIILVAGILILIIIPFCLWGERIDDFVKICIDRGSAHPLKIGALLVALLAGDIVLPTPSSLISTGCGALLGFYGGMLASFVGMTISCISGYIIGRYAAEHFVKKLMGESNMQTLIKLSGKYGRWCVLVTRAVPVLAEASVLFAGLGKEKFSEFLLVTSMSNLVISGVYAYIGSYATSMNSFLIVFVGGITVPGIVMLTLQAVIRGKKVHGVR
ncbi:MAG: VTT domain-containing protein [Kiritimatiellae bacterium]|jgi:uncharacterized membrane protein YdjX (TVP38/TMEM64 family)|nr:VTT domain-containing protein [Kiritimatiellia bacterium]